jgi:ATP sulfurylase
MPLCGRILDVPISLLEEIMQELEIIIILLQHRKSLNIILILKFSHYSFQHFIIAKNVLVIQMKEIVHTDQNLEMRELINRAETPAEHLMRPEISKLIVSYKNPFIK